MNDYIKNQLNKLIISKDIFIKYSDEIDDYNISSLKKVSFVGMFFSYILTFLSLPFINILSMRIPYTILAIIFTITFISTKFSLKNHKKFVQQLYYLMATILFLTGIVMGTILDQSTNATTFLLFILIIPLFIIDRPWRLNLFNAVMSIIFCIAAISFKSGDILSLDISNTSAVFLLSITFNIINIRQKIRDFQFRRAEQNKAFEKETFLNAVPTGIGIFEIHNGVIKQTYMNDGFFRLMEDNRENRNKRTNDNFLLSVHDDDRQNVIESIQQIIDGENYVEITCRSIKGDCSFKWIRFTSSVAKREDNFILVYSAYFSMEDEMNSRNSLEKSRAILESAVSSANMTVWEYDCLNKCIYQDEHSIEKHGFESVIRNIPESLIDKGYVHKDSIDQYRKIYQKLHETQKTVQGDFYVHSENRSGYWWEHIILTPVIDDSGKMIKAIGTSIDVTDQKKKEEQYYKQIGIMSDIGDKNLIAKAQYNLTKQKMIYYSPMNSNAVQLQGDESFEQILEKMISIQPDEQIRNKILKHFTRNNLLNDFAAGKVEGSIQYKRRIPNKAIIFANTKYLISADPQSGDVMLFIYCYDDTSHMIEQRIIAQLGSSEYDTIGVIDIITNNCIFKNMSSELKKIYNESNSDFYKISEYIINNNVIPENRKEMTNNMCIKNIISRLSANKIYEFSYSAYNDKDEIRRKKIQFQYLDNGMSSILFTCSDITDFYRQEQEQMLKLRKALTEAKQATQAKTDFLSRMSHDIRTPLNAILGTAALAKDELNNPDAIKQYLETIDSSGHFLLGLINDILDINKIESGNIELRPEVYGINDFISTINNTINPIMNKKHINFNFEMKCKYNSIFVDKLRYNQIFFNLLSNAAKYTPEYGKVDFIIEPIESPHDMAGIRNIVRDNGIGMSKEYMKHLFEPFTRDNNAAINHTEGSGLGLAIVKSIVDAMNGKIIVKSEPEKGSEFIVELFIPIADNEICNIEDTKKFDESKLKGKHILLVEDNELNSIIVLKILEKKDCIVTIKSNGLEAVNHFSELPENSYDLILMDIRMPIMNGLEATQAIRNLNRHDAQTIPIIALTADAFNEDIYRTTRAGMNGHLTKPVEPKKLYEIISQNLN